MDTISGLVDGQILVSIDKSTKVRDALTVMIGKDFSQLPVVNEDGNLVGLINERSISRALIPTNGKISVLDLSVEHCHEPALTFSGDTEVFDALNRFEGHSAAIVIENGKPIAIVTGDDLAKYIRDFSESLVLIRDIETKLRMILDSEFSDEKKQREAVALALPGSKYDKLTLFEEVRLVCYEAFWPKFEPILKPKELFQQTLDSVREIRNQLMHFRSETNLAQLDLLRRANWWMRNRPTLQPEKSVGNYSSSNMPLIDPAQLRQESEGQGKYAPLGAYLRKIDSSINRFTHTFEDIEYILSDLLPPVSIKSIRHGGQMIQLDMFNHKCG